MGIVKRASISSVLFTGVQRQILGLLFGNPGKDFYTNEIIAKAKSGNGAVQRELAKLMSAGLITVKQIGNQKHYQANRGSPLFSELRSIVLKTFGLADVLRDALKPLTKQIDIAFIYGSIANQEDNAKSDIDLMIISDKVTYAELFKILAKTEKQLGRPVNPTFHSPAEWSKKFHQANNFISQLIQKPKIFLIGTEHELTELK